MKITKTTIWIWLLLFLPFFAFRLHERYKAIEQYENRYNGILTGYIGSKFPLKNFIDSSGRDALIDVSKSEMTVVDFWFKECPPCIADMQQYSELIRERDKQINVFTVSINRYDLWKSLLLSTNKPFSMFSEQIPNWKHLALKSDENPKFKNDIPADNLSLLVNTFKSNSFPMYFVLDKDGVITATPFSLAKYMELNILGRNPFWYFITNKTTWSGDYLFAPVAFVEYSGYFWIVMILILAISSKFRSNRQLNKQHL